MRCTLPRIGSLVFACLNGVFDYYIIFQMHFESYFLNGFPTLQFHYSFSSEFYSFVLLEIVVRV
jgi:hypothetical protein